MAKTEQIEQASGSLLRILCEGDYLINGDKERFTAYRDTLNAILALGDVEHSGDWDPYLKITLNDGSTIGTENGYSEMEDHETLEDTIIIMVCNHLPSMDNWEPIEKHIKISDIKSIEVLV